MKGLKNYNFKNSGLYKMFNRTLGLTLYFIDRVGEPIFEYPDSYYYNKMKREREKGK